MRHIGFTGHRPDRLGGYSAATRGRLKDLVESVFFLLRVDFQDWVHVGMAQGFDMAVAKAHDMADGRVAAHLPFHGQDSRWPVDVRAEYMGLLASAKTRNYYSEEAQKLGRNPYLVRNQAIVNNSELLVALWDGSSSGTGNTVAYARKAGVPVLNVWPMWEEIMENSA